MNDIDELIERKYEDSDGNKCSLRQMIKREPGWAANRIREGEDAITALQEMQGRIKELEGCMETPRIEDLELIAKLEADLDALHKWPTWKEQCDHIHALTNERLRLDAALGEIEALNSMDYWPGMRLAEAIDIARKARASERE